MWSDKKQSSRRTRFKRKQLSESLSNHFKQFKVCRCNKCGKWGTTTSNTQFKCFRCNKIMVLKKLNEYELNLQIYSYDDARDASEAVRKLNEYGEKENV